MANEETTVESTESNNNFNYSEPNTQEEDLTSDDLNAIMRTLPNMPAGRLKDILKFMKDLENDENVSANYKQYFASNASSQLALMGRYTVVNNDIYDQPLNDGENNFKNDVTYGDKKLNVRNIEMSNTDVNPKTAVARFTKFIDAGEIIQVPLWHSGFWVTIKPPKQKDFIALEQEIADNHITLGRETSTLIFSNYQVMVNRILVSFIARHITEYTVKLDSASDDIFSYINIQDLPALTLGILSSIFPKGLEYIKPCRGNLELQEGIKTCNNLIKATLDTKKLLFVNRQALTKDMLDHMSQRRPDSVPLSAVKEYQRKIQSLSPRTFTVLDDKVEVTLELPNINKYIDTGDKWVESIISEFESTLTDNVDDTTKNTKINNIVATIYLGLYNTFVKSIKFQGENRSYSDQETIDAMLERLSEKPEGVKPFLEQVNKYISESAIAIVATPAYECSVCKTSDKESDVKLKSGFENLVPLNMVYLFFGLSALSKTNLYRALNTY